MEKLIDGERVKNVYNISERVLSKYFKPRKYTYNFHNPKRPIRLYAERDVLSKLRDTAVYSEISMKYADPFIEYRRNCTQNQDKLLQTLISQIHVIELPLSTIILNALIDVSNLSYYNAERYVKTIFSRLNRNSVKKIIANYIAKNLIEYTPLYCRTFEKSIYLTRVRRQQYVQAIIDKATFTYPICRSALQLHLSQIDEFKFCTTLRELKYQQSLKCNRLNRHKELENLYKFYDELDDYELNTTAVNVEDYE